MRKKSSRKHLLGQQVSTITPVNRRLSVRVPKLLDRMIEQGYEAEGISRNKWFSNTMIRFRQRQVVDQLALPPYVEPTEEELAAGTEPEATTADKQRHVEDVNRALALLVKETFISTTGGTSLPVRFTDEGLDAMQDMLDRIDAVQQLPPITDAVGNPVERAVDVSNLTNVRTVLVHAALWDRIMEGRNMEEVALLMRCLQDDDASEQLEIPDLFTEGAISTAKA